MNEAETRAEPVHLEMWNWPRRLKRFTALPEVTAFR